jgi:hypothetical protein
MSGTLDQNAIRDAKLVTSVPRPVRLAAAARAPAGLALQRIGPSHLSSLPCEQDGEGEIKLFLTSTTNSPSTGPGFGYKTVKSKAQIYFYYDPARFPEGKEDPQVASAIQRCQRDVRVLLGRLRVWRQTAPV